MDQDPGMSQSTEVCSGRQRRPDIGGAVDKESGTSKLGWSSAPKTGTYIPWTALQNV